MLLITVAKSSTSDTGTPFMNFAEFCTALMKVKVRRYDEYRNDSPELT